LQIEPLKRLIYNQQSTTAQHRITHQNLSIHSRVMPKKTLKQLAMSPARLKEIKILNLLGDWLHEPNLWHINRFSASMAFFVGLFCAFLPVPGQTLVAAFLAVMLRCNLPLSVGLIWITNPITMAPIFYTAYSLGAMILDTPVEGIEFQLSTEWLADSLSSIWQPLLLGSLICGLFFGSLGYFVINMLWRWRVTVHWKRRKKRRELAAQLIASRPTPREEFSPEQDAQP
jgi:uncharacterized protein